MRKYSKGLFDRAELGTRAEVSKILLDCGALGSREELVAVATNGKLNDNGSQH